ncbi:sigma-E processing peptidase SpoIIGA [Virgibacillus byunsanensis]|uniref:Sporulation sigma-E factor-processing peptidase n=1 Tax=Virgibacillus byunsanensis TaxID=570945 RepID=A0ABW3LIC8_9BACI
MVTIYLDAVWLLNFCLDLMLLMLTQALGRNNTRKFRLVLGAMIASFLVPISLYFPESFLTSIIGKLIYSVLIILCTFRFQSIYQTLKLLLLFYFTTFAIGGGLIATHYIFQNPIGVASSGILTFDSGYGDPISWVFVIVGFPIISLFTKHRMDRHAAEKIRYEQLCPITIQVNNISFSTTGYIDSGNQLVDPLTKKPVIVCDEEFLKNWFSETDWKLLEVANKELNFEDLPNEWEKRIHIIPFQGVEGKSMFMLAIKPDRLVVYHNNEKMITSKVLIGIQFGQLTKDQSYHCLLHPQIIKVATVHTA